MKEKVSIAIGTLQDYLLKELGISIEKQTQLFTDQRPMITGLIKDTLGSFTSIFTFFMIILIYVVLLLYYRSHIKDFILMLSPQSKREEMSIVVNSVAKVSQQYLLGLSKMIVCLWVMYGIGFSALGIKNALFFAFLCGLLEIVPFIGNITGTTITLLMAALHGSSPAVLAAIVGGYGTVQFVQGWVLEPLIVGSQVKINPLSTIIALILGELVWGIPGIFLAIPLVAMLKIVCDNIETLKPYGFLIGETEKKKKTKK
jgi:predicted PurR-regulated permease PerM